MADDFSPEMIDGLRDLCLAVAQLAANSIHSVGAMTAREVVAAAGRLSTLLDTLEADRG